MKNKNQKISNKANAKPAEKFKVFNKNGWKCRYMESTGEFECTLPVKLSGKVYTAILSSKNTDDFGGHDLLLKDSLGAEKWITSMLPTSLGIEALIHYWDCSFGEMGITKIYGASAEAQKSSESPKSSKTHKYVTIALVEVQKDVYRTLMVEGFVNQLFDDFKSTEIIDFDEILIEDLRRAMATILEYNSKEIQSIKSSKVLTEDEKFQYKYAANDHMLAYLSEINRLYWNR